MILLDKSVGHRISGGGCSDASLVGGTTGSGRDYESSPDSMRVMSTAAVQPKKPVSL